MNRKMRMDSEQCPIALVDDGNVVTLMQVPMDDSWVQMLQLELERLQKSRMKVGNHVSQLLMLCTQESHTSETTSRGQQCRRYSQAMLQSQVKSILWMLLMAGSIMGCKDPGLASIAV